MKKYITFIASLLLLSGTIQAQHTALSVVIQVRPQHQLPLLLPSITVDVINSGPDTATIPNLFALEVIGPTGGFTATGPIRRTATSLGVAQAAALTVPAHGTTHFVFPATLETPVFFCDPRFAAPGTYRVRLIADRNVALPSVALPVIDHSRLYAPVMSNESTFIVDTPTGVDAVVWRRMTALGMAACEVGSESALANEIWSKYPDSRYAIAFIPRNAGDSRASYIERLNTAIRRNPTSDLSDLVWMLLAEQHKEAMSEALSQQRSLEQANSLADQARSDAAHVIQRGANPDLAAQARDFIDEVPTSDALQRELALYSGTSTPHDDFDDLLPIVNCATTTSDGMISAQLGYLNGSDHTLNLAVGSSNGFQPGAANLGQPVKFDPGRHDHVFRITSKSDGLTWHLGSHALAIASTRDTPACGETHDTARP